MIRVVVVAAVLLASAACASSEPVREPTGDSAALARTLTAIERRWGGRLGVAVTDTTGRLLFGQRADERFAMCSTFKLLLAGQVLHDAANGGLALDTSLPLVETDLLPHSPYSETQLAAGELRLGSAAEHSVKISDNAAANLILKATGGPPGFTRHMRAMGDAVTRLDRTEPDLNENVPGDPRDTTSPAAMAKSGATLVYGDYLDADGRRTLRSWLVGSTTGRARLRGGLPPAWIAGDKTGSCGTAYNDVAFVEAPDGGRYMVAAYLDRPTVNGDAADAILAEVGRAVAENLPD
ncbi:class A beta-lactamase [Sphingopyxis lindanitolerans]|uniref:Beta-lactamase n=1 Tax=Sphingopyxis lindanitolerans TaxID=2054227 RepID=A0A2S8B442_9SPHN|nr:class A beta-lactamase [Sphingopyxis lindanitolerans]PQM27127.1 class A beta-lactamase [Sphingopyxis lindanitolerans]